MNAKLAGKLKLENERLRDRVSELEALINTPQTEDFLRAVELEAAHQLQRWGIDNRDQKTDADWLWLMAYLSAKAVFGKDTIVARCMADSFRHEAVLRARTQIGCDGGKEKQLHRIISVAAGALNWHRDRWPE